MAIYLLFIQHIIASLKPGGKAAVVVPTGFITAASGIELRIRQKLVDEKMIAGVVSMPSNIFATTGTNVSILFLDASQREQVVLIDASALGTRSRKARTRRPCSAMPRSSVSSRPSMRARRWRISRWWWGMTRLPRRIIR